MQPIEIDNMKPRTYPLTDAFIERLKIKMKETGMKKTALAKLIGVSKQYLNFYFSTPRKRSPNCETTLKILDIFK